MPRRWAPLSIIAYLGLLLAGTLNSTPPPPSVVGGPQPPGYTFGIDLIPIEFRQAAKAAGAASPLGGEAEEHDADCSDSPT